MIQRLGTKAALSAMGIAIALVVIFSIPAPWWGIDVSIVDVILPQWDHDSRVHPEPSIAVDPTDPKRIVLSAYLLGNTLTSEEGFCGSDYSGLVMSLDGGSSWTQRCPLPKGSSEVAGDVAIDFLGDGSALMAAYLPHSQRGGVEAVSAIEDADATTSTNVPIPNPTVGVDQPFIVAGGAGSQTYSVGTYQEIDYDRCHGTGVVWWWNSKGANDWSCVSKRDGWDMSVRTAQAVDGTIYGLFFNLHDTDDYSDLVLVRGRLSEDVNGGSTFDDLNDDVFLDPAIPASDPCAIPDHALGQRLKNCTSVPIDKWNGIGICESVGHQVRNTNQLALVVDPDDSHTIYFAYADTPQGKPFTLHLAKWSDASGTRQVDELLAIPNALNPALAITKTGRIALAYQQHTDGTWQTLAQVGKRASLAWMTVVLSDRTPDTEPSIASCSMTSPYLGDYMDIAAVGDEFYGSFSFNNNPAHNPTAVYLRDQTLLGTTDVPYTIDPFFYKLRFEQSGFHAGWVYLRVWTANVVKNWLRFWGRPIPGFPKDTAPPIPPKK